jgi:hypothetical protein
MKEKLNRLVIGVATMAVDSFRNRGSRLSRPADLYGSRFCSSFRTSAIWIWVKVKLGRIGRVAAGGAELLAEVGVARRKAWPAVVGDQAYHCCVIGKLNDGVGVVPGHAVMSEQGVQEGNEHAPLRGPLF